jgi:hypothetical protein
VVTICTTCFNITVVENLRCHGGALTPDRRGCLLDAVPTVPLCSRRSCRVVPVTRPRPFVRSSYHSVVRLSLQVAISCSTSKQAQYTPNKAVDDGVRAFECNYSLVFGRFAVRILSGPVLSLSRQMPDSTSIVSAKCSQIQCSSVLLASFAI